jgi:hypothetical protein
VEIDYVEPMHARNSRYGRAGKVKEFVTCLLLKLSDKHPRREDLSAPLVSLAELRSPQPLPTIPIMTLPAITSFMAVSLRTPT